MKTRLINQYTESTHFIGDISLDFDEKKVPDLLRER